MDDDCKCLFSNILQNCKSYGRVDKVLTEKNKSAVLQSSQERKDGFFANSQNYSSHQCHKNCLYEYTSKEKIRRYLNQKRKSIDEPDTSIPRKSQRLSPEETFDFKKFCFFCGKTCEISKPKGCRNPKRWKKGILCRTADRGKSKEGIRRLQFKEVILKVCDERGDKWADEVRTRLAGSVSDLHAAGGRYHDCCYKEFTSERNIAAARKATCQGGIEQDMSLQKVLQYLANNKGKPFSSTEIVSLYEQEGGCSTKKYAIMQKVHDYFGSDIVVLRSSGFANVVIFRSYANKYLKLDQSSESQVPLTEFAKQVKHEVKDLYYDSSCYKRELDEKTLADDCSKTILNFLAKLSPSLDHTAAAFLIGSIITSAIMHRPTSLQLSLSVLLRDKLLIDHLEKFKVCSTYKEFLQFRTSVAVADSVLKFCEFFLPAEQGLVQSIIDNFDLTIFTPNGNKETHDLAIIHTQYGSKTYAPLRPVIPRIAKRKLPQVDIPDAVVYSCKNTKTSLMPENVVKLPVLPLRVLCMQFLSVDQAKSLDFMFLQNITVSEGVPEYSGYNTKLNRGSSDPMPATKIFFPPLINRSPKDPATIYTAMKNSMHCAKETGQTFAVLSADQDIYKVVISILWAYPDEFNEKNFIPRIGGLHWIMSFIGCIGSLMKNTGLEDVLSQVFGSVPKMLLGKLYPNNFRALRLFVEVLLSNDIKSFARKEDLYEHLEEISKRSKTSAAWVQNVVKPVFLIMLFVRAEREGDWLLHLYSCWEMMPYFYAANHGNYARYGLIYIMYMLRMKDNIREKFMQGQHVMRHIKGCWNGTWSDMLMETTAIRQGKGNLRQGGLVGKTVRPEQVKKSCISFHTFLNIKDDLQKLIEVDDKYPGKHKEEQPHRLQLDKKDRANLKAVLTSCLHPLRPSTHAETNCIVNIFTGDIADDKVNIHQSVEIGTHMMKTFCASLPDGFKKTISRKTVFFTKPKVVHINERPVVDTNVIFSRAMCLISSGQLDIKTIFSHELCSFPPSLFHQNGEPRYCTTKSTLKNMLERTVSRRSSLSPDYIIIDACALLWTISWPSAGSVKDFADLVMAKVCSYATSAHVYVVFDRYYEYSIKSCTRQRRLSYVCQEVDLKLTTPLPSQSVLLKFTKNKIKLIKLLAEYLLQNFPEDSPKRLIVTSGHPTPKQVFKGSITERDDLRTTHEEADVIIPRQVISAMHEGASCVRVICDDTDVFLLLLHTLYPFNTTVTVQMDSPKNEDRGLVDIIKTGLANKDLVPCLLAAHSISGCDTVPQYYGIGKKRVLKTLNSFPLQNLGDDKQDFENILSESKSFIAACYGITEISSTTFADIRYTLWKRKISAKSSTGFRLCTLPPTEEALHQNVLRAHYQCMLWKKCLEDPPALNPTNHGWVKDKTRKVLDPVGILKSTPVAPDKLLKIISCSCVSETRCTNNQCSCMKNNLLCNEFCKCSMSGCPNVELEHDNEEEDSEEEVDDCQNQSQE